MQQSRSEWIDIAKAIGIFLVVIAHTYRGIVDSGAKFPPFLSLIDSIIYTFHMPLFFFISGIFFVKSIEKRSLQQFFVSKLDTVAYPYLIWGTLQGLLIAFLFARGVANQNVSYQDVFMFWKPLGQFWFLHDLFFIMCFTALIYKFSKLRFLGALILIATVLYIFQTSLRGIYFVSFMAKNWIFFLLGIYLFKSQLKAGLFYDKLYITFLVLLAIVLQYLFHVTLQFNYESKGVLSLLLAIIMSFVTLKLAYRLEGKVGGWLLLIGRHSMAIYLLHVFFASGVRIIDHKLLQIYNPYFDLFAGTILGIFIPVLVACFVDSRKIPFIFSFKQ